MSDLITIQHLTGLVQTQARLMAVAEEQALPPHDTIFPERNEHALEVDGEPWSATVGPRSITYIQRNTGHSVELASDHPSPFAFTVPGLVHYIRSIDEASRVTEVVVENWVVANFRKGRLVALDDYAGHYTFAN